MRILAVTVLISLCAASGFAAETLKNEEDKTIYSIGLIISRQLSAFSLTPAELELVKVGMTDGVNNTPGVDLAAYNAKVQELAKTRITAQAEKMAPLNKELLEKAAQENGAIKTDSGLIYRSLKEGSGSVPGPKGTVKVHYRGTLANGKEFDSSYQRGTPLEFKLDSVIACWKEGVQKMKPGGKAKLVCPPALAYGDAGMSSVILPGSTLAFEVELLEVSN